MALATITSKGQVTIPKKIRESLKLQAGDKIEILVTSTGKEALMKPISKRVDDVFCKLHNPDRPSVSLEDMDEAIRDRMAGKFR